MPSSIAFQDLASDRHGDEELVFLYQEFAIEEAKATLVSRHLEAICRRVSIEARVRRLSAEDIEDAIEAGMVALLEAVEVYDIARTTVEDGGFRRFLKRRVKDRFHDFLRTRARATKHLEPGAVLEDVAEKAPERIHAVIGHGDWRPSAHSHLASQAAATLDREDTLERLHAVLPSLSAEERQLFTLLWNGTPIREIAAVLDVTYHTAKQRRHRLLCKLTSKLRPPQTDTHTADSHKSRPH